VSAVKRKKKALKKRSIEVRESGAEPYKIDELYWLVEWSKSNGLEQYIGKLVGFPELVFDHAAGRVYRIVTNKKDQYYIVVGCGFPAVYPAQKELCKPEEILSYHRGSGLISRLKIEYKKKKKKLRQKGIVLRKGE
jgi:hypothetical protein